MDKWKKKIGAGVDAESMPPCRSAGTVEPRRALIHKRRSTAAAPHKPAAHFNKRKTDSPKSGRTCCHAPLDFDAVVAQRRQGHKSRWHFPQPGLLFAAGGLQVRNPFTPSFRKLLNIYLESQFPFSRTFVDSTISIYILSLILSNFIIYSNTFLRRIQSWVLAYFF